METITHKYQNCPSYTFEIVEEVPLGYMIWNIGHCMADGYLPLCRISRHQRWPGGRQIETDTLKAIRTDAAQDILAAVGGPGIYTLSDMERYVEKHRNSKDPYTRDVVQRCKKAIPAMRNIKGINYLTKQ